MYKEPFKEFEVRTVENKLEVFQELVGGYIETVTLPYGVIMVCNEEGKIRDLHPNIAVGHDIIRGNVLFIGFDGEEDFGSLTDIQEAWVRRNI